MDSPCRARQNALLGITQSEFLSDISLDRVLSGFELQTSVAPTLV